MVGHSFAQGDKKSKSGFSIGWASADITPDKPVVIAGGSSARVSTGVKDPITATALVLQSARDGSTGETVVLVSVDVVAISDLLKKRVNELIQKTVPAANVNKVILNATHTHTAPDTRDSPEMARMHAEIGVNVPEKWSGWGVDLGVMPPVDYVEFAAKEIAGAIKKALDNRKPGGVSFGLAHARVGQNRLTAYYDGRSEMYGKTNDPEFSHIEGFEDHSLGLLYTWDTNEKLTGIVVNVAIPSQAEYGDKLSADFWHETRLELRRQLGKDLFILPQTAAAGDQSPRIMVDRRAEERMQKLTGRTERQQIAVRITDAVKSILPFMKQSIEWNPVLMHKVEFLDLTRRQISESDIKTRRRTFHTPVVESVEEAYPRLLAEYKRLYKELSERPELKQEKNWFTPITATHWRLGRAWSTLERFELQKTEPTIPIEVHVIRIGDMAMATNPFELYVDFGSQLKARSKAVQTFIVELATPSRGYLPTSRSVAGGAYGAIPQSTQIGPEGGRILVNETLEIIDSMFPEE